MSGHTKTPITVGAITENINTATGDMGADPTLYDTHDQETATETLATESPTQKPQKSPKRKPAGSGNAKKNPGKNATVEAPVVLVSIPLQITNEMGILLNKTSNRKKMTIQKLFQEIMEEEFKSLPDDGLIEKYMYPQRKTIRKTIMMPSDFRERIHEAAAEYGMKKTNFISYAIERYMIKEKLL